MKNYRTRFFIAITGFFLPALCFGQQDSSIQSNTTSSISGNPSVNSIATGKDVFSLGVNYQSRLHYFGRTDSLQSSAFLPTIGFQFKWGLYVQGTGVLIQNTLLPTTYVGTTIEGGFRFHETEHFRGNIFYTQIIYKDNTDLPQSAINGQTGINATWINKIMNVTGGADLKFSAKTDVGATLGLDHLFLFHEGTSKVALAIDPAAYLFAGTQNFTNITNKSVGGIPVPVETSEAINRFNVLSYEFSLPVVFVAGKFNASVTPSYVMPQNLVVIANHPELSEYGKNLFYVTVGIGFRLL